MGGQNFYVLFIWQEGCGRESWYEIFMQIVLSFEKAFHLITNLTTLPFVPTMSRRPHLAPPCQMEF